MDILLTFAGNRDPFNQEIIKGSFTEGPVLTLLQERLFPFIYIFTTPNTLENAQKLQEEIANKSTTTQISIFNIDIPDPTDYEQLYIHMSRFCREIQNNHKKQKAAYYIAISSGTPQMQTIWFLLSQSGQFPSTLLKITPPRFLQRHQKAVSEVNLSLEKLTALSSLSPKQLDVAATYLRKEKLEAERVDLMLDFSQYSMIGKSTALSSILDTIKAASQYDSAVLIQGETGTGKELVARAIHFNSSRKIEPFIVVNCAAIPESLVESELFGHEKGAFTGAIQQKKGKFELADKGTIFLDEVGDMSLAAQAKILRVLQDQEITRIGGAKAIKTNVRIIAATNRNLIEFIQEGKFRQDLYFRLKVIDIKTPALRDRKEDIPLLVEYFLLRHNHSYKQNKQLTPEALRLLLEYHWPGNIRELENSIERAFVLSKGAVIKENDLPPEINANKNDLQAKTHRQGTPKISIPEEGINFDEYLKDLEKSFYEEAIRMEDGNREAAANLLKIKPHTFRKRARKNFEL